MTTVLKDAHAAAFFSQADPIRSRFLDEIGFFGPIAESSNVQWKDRIDDLLRIRSLTDDWDGEGTIAPHPSLVDGAITLCQTLQSKGSAPPDRVHAGVNETVFLEWHTPAGYQEIEVLSPVEAECRSVPRGSDSVQVCRLVRFS
jgi:hypothetical protein